LERITKEAKVNIVCVKRLTFNFCLWSYHCADTFRDE